MAGSEAVTKKFSNGEPVVEEPDVDADSGDESDEYEIANEGDDDDDAEGEYDDAEDGTGDEAEGEGAQGEQAKNGLTALLLGNPEVEEDEEDEYDSEAEEDGPEVVEVPPPASIAKKRSIDEVDGAADTTSADAAELKKTKT